MSQDPSPKPARGSLELGRQPDIRAYRGKHPQIAASAYIDPAAVIIGDVAIGEDSSVWPCTVIPGDVHHIRIGGDTGKPVAGLGESAPGTQSLYALARAVTARLAEVSATSQGPSVSID